MLLISIGITPLIWTIYIKKQIVNHIKMNHGQNYAIIGLNVNHYDARETFHFNMYERLYTYMCFKYGDNYYFNAYHHCAVLVSDNDKIYRYYWSIRENNLVLDESKQISDEFKTLYRYVDTDIAYKHGMRFKANVDDQDIRWYP